VVAVVAAAVAHDVPKFAWSPSDLNLEHNLGNCRLARLQIVHISCLQWQIWDWSKRLVMLKGRVINARRQAACGTSRQRATSIFSSLVIAKTSNRMIATLNPVGTKYKYLC
jgi:hypothetical protein